MAEGSHMMHNRDLSPLGQHDGNIQSNLKKQVVFKYLSNEYQMRMPPKKSLQKNLAPDSTSNLAG